MSAHTPTPWSLYEDEPRDRIAAPIEMFTRRSTMGDYKSASLTNDRGEFHNPADAAFIVRACNTHDALLAAVKQWASECGECNGTGVVQAFIDASASGFSHAYPGRDEPCDQCADIRAHITKAEGP